MFGYEYSIDAKGVRVGKCTLGSTLLRIPAQVEGVPVTRIGPLAFQGLAHVERIECPATVIEIGTRAFANCHDLRELVLPETLARYDNSWVAGCSSLEEIILPGAVEGLSLPSPAPSAIRRVTVGAGTRDVQLSRTWKARLEQVFVDERNQWLSTDGTCFYSADGSVLLAHATSSTEVLVREGCREIAPEAFAYEVNLAHIELPDTVERIGTRAYAESALPSFTAPAHLRSIGEEAFAVCKQLASVQLNDELIEIAAGAFRECTVLGSLRIPASVEHLSCDAFDQTSLEAAGESAPLSIDCHNERLFFDDQGVLYERIAGSAAEGGDSPDGLILRAPFNAKLVAYRASSGTIEVALGAFKSHQALEHVELPEGVVRIGEEAFMLCERLRTAVLPETLVEIGPRAFATTVIRELEIPASVDELGECALAFNFRNWHPTTNPPESRAHVTLAPGSRRFFVESGLLCERIGEGEARVVLYTGPEIDVRVPDQVREIAPYAFFGVHGLRTLRLRDDVAVGDATFAMRKPPERVILVSAEDGSTVQLWTLNDWRGVCALQRSFAITGLTDPERLFSSFDEEAASAKGDFPLYRYLAGRLASPDYLSERMHQAFEERLRDDFAEACAAFAKHEARESFDDLVKVGLIDRSNVDDALAAIAPLRRAAMNAYLYEIKRTRLGGISHDYAL